MVLHKLSSPARASSRSLFTDWHVHESARCFRGRKNTIHRGLIRRACLHCSDIAGLRCSVQAEGCYPWSDYARTTRDNVGDRRRVACFARAESSRGAHNYNDNAENVRVDGTSHPWETDVNEPQQQEKGTARGDPSSLDEVKNASKIWASMAPGKLEVTA